VEVQGIVQRVKVSVLRRVVRVVVVVHAETDLCDVVARQIRRGGGTTEKICLVQIPIKWRTGVSNPNIVVFAIGETGNKAGKARGIQGIGEKGAPGIVGGDSHRKDARDRIQAWRSCEVRV